MENIHTYKHARRVRNSRQRKESLPYQTFLWPTPQPHFLEPSLYDLRYEPSQHGPPVRTVEDLIAYQYLQIHRPDVFKLNTSSVLDSVDDREFDSYEKRKRQEATERFNKRYASYTSQFDREVNGMTSKVKTKQQKPPKRSKYFDDMTPGSVNTWNSVGTQKSETIPVHYAEEYIISPCSESIIEQTFVPSIVQYAVTTLAVEPQRAVITGEKIESLEQSSCRQQDSDDTQCVTTVRWSKRRPRRDSLIHKRRVIIGNTVRSKRQSPVKLRTGKCSVNIYLHVPDIGLKSANSLKADTYIPSILWNYKKRRRKCDEYAH